MQAASNDLPDYGDDAITLSRPARTESAVAQLERQFQQRPGSAALCMELATALVAAHRLQDAVGLLSCRCPVHARQPGFLTLYGQILLQLGQTKPAIGALLMAIELDPRDSKAQSHLGLAFLELGERDRAFAHCSQAWRQCPGADAAVAFSKVLLATGDYAEAAAVTTASLTRHAAAAHDTIAQTYSNQGYAYSGLNQYALALESFARALSLNPESADAHFGAALCHLVTGDFARGWAGYEWRWQRHGLEPLKGLGPQWGGEDLHGKTLLVVAEQGLGDTLQFARFLPLLVARGATVIAAVPTQLRSVLPEAGPQLRYIVDGEAFPQHDLSCPLLSLPLALGTTVETIPASVPYLVCPLECVRPWRIRLGLKTRPRVGVVWSGSRTHGKDAARSIPLAAFAALFDGQCDFVSLQPDVRPSDEAAMAATPDLVDVRSELTSFEATAGLIGMVDLVMAVDTAVAHLAGGLGKPVWVLLPFAPDWRWLTDRSDSPWYPTARLWRQTAPDDWSSVLDDIRRALHDWVASLPGDRLPALGRHNLSPDHHGDAGAHARLPAVIACKICGTAAPCCGSVDFNRNCESRRGLVLPLSGKKITYQRCPDCGFVFTSAFDLWHPGDFKREIYNQDYRLVDPDYETLRPMGCAEQIGDFFAPDKATLHVLDYGGGNGLMSSELLRAGFASARTYDPFNEDYAILPTTQFDVVTCFETLEHVPDPLTTIGQICSLVKPGGMVVFSTLLQPDVFDLNWWYLAPRNGHISLFSKAAQAAAWSKHGFQVGSWNADLHAAFREVPGFAPLAIKNSQHCGAKG